VPKGRHPRPAKYVWTKEKRAPNKKDLFVLCAKCSKITSKRLWRRHYRCCVLKMTTCPVCHGVHPCRNEICPWFRPDPVNVPDHLVPYFKAEDKDEVRDLELEALAFVRASRRAWKRLDPEQ
jgi:hypothetical protein